MEPLENDPPIVTVQVKQLSPFSDSGFKTYKDTKTHEDLKSSIKDNGVLQSIVVWKQADGSQTILVGHHRKMACDDLGIKEIPVIVVQDIISDKDLVIHIDTNQGRGVNNMLPSKDAIYTQSNGI